MTKTAQHTFIFRLWVHVRGLLAIAIVLFGILVGLASLILPNESLYKQYIVNFLSQQWDKQVSIDEISGKWQGFGPKFIINGLSIKDKDEVVVQQATLNINVFKYLLPKGSTGITLGINDIAVDFEKKTSGKIVLKDESKKKESFTNKLSKLLETGNLSVNNFTFNLHDTQSDKDSQIHSSILVQQNNNQRAFELKLDTPELADSIVIKAIADRSRDLMQQAHWYARAQKLSLEDLGKLLNKKYLPKAFVEAQMWFSTENGNINHLIAKAELKNKLFENKAEITGEAELVYYGSKDKWNAELIFEDIKTQSISQKRIKVELNRSDNFIYLNADVLDVPLLKAITHVLGVSNESFDTLDLMGQLNEVYVKYDVSLRRIVAANIHFQSLNLKAQFGQLNNLAGEISLKDEQIRLLLDSDTGSAELPDFMRGVINWDKLLITAQTSMQDEDLDIRINSVWCDCQDFILDGAMRITFDEDMMLDLSVAIYQAKVNQLYKYWPSFKWKPKVLNFLDQALVNGTVDKGMIIYHGRPIDYPFAQKQGVFLTKSHLINAQVNYHKDWPMVNNFSAVVDTNNLKLMVQSTQGKVMQAQVKQVTAEIPNLKSPLLTVDVDASGKDSYLLDFLKQSPMRKGLKVLDQDMDLKGSQSIKVNLAIPLNHPDAKFKPKGHILFKKTDFKVGHFQLFNIIGAIDFEGFSLHLKNLTALFLNQPVVLTGSIVNEPLKPVAMDVNIRGDYDVKNFEKMIGSKLPASGQSSWKFSISNKTSEEICFTAESNLTGISLDMPEPLAKKPEQLAPFSITCTLPCIDGGWDLSYDNKLTSNFSLNAITNEVKLNQLIFGKSSDTDTFGGQLDKVDVDKWIDVFVNTKTEGNKSALPFKQMSVHVNELKFMSRILKDVAVDIIKENDNLIFTVNAEDIKGSITVADDIDKKGIFVNLDKLHWQKPEIEAISETISNVSTSYPALHVWIGDFIYDGIPLGEASIEVRPVNEGVRVEKFNTKSDLMSLTINGKWQRGIGKRGLSSFNIIMTSKDIAKFLVNLGFQAPISEAQTIIDMQATWLDFPSQFEIKKINGKMHIEVGQGEVVDAKPGMGRVLGLFSLTNLPRRLILDFKDVFGKGLAFQSMQGDFILKEGEAITDSFIIDSSSAQIVVSGKTGLANQDYDQTVVVVPRVGRVLPTIGAITGGAVGAAAGFFVQGMFHKGLKDVGKIIYKVTGSWDDPKIELIKTEDKTKNQ
jgi:uncharacterized protein (TIGR02099 family)